MIVRRISAAVIIFYLEQTQRKPSLVCLTKVILYHQIDPEEERKILAKEKKASMEYFSNTLKRHTLVLKKRDLMRRKAEAERKKVISQLLAAEGLELEPEDEESRNRNFQS